MEIFPAAPHISTAGGETTTTFSWATNGPLGFWSLPARTVTMDQDGAVLTESVMIYDGLPEGQALRGPPTKALELVKPGSSVLLKDIMARISPDLGGYFASPRKEIGIPSWALSGTWPGMISGQPAGGAAALLQTMPLAR